MVTLLVLLFYWKGLGAYFNSLDLREIKVAVDSAHRWYIGPEVWRPINYMLLHGMYGFFSLKPLPYHLMSLILYTSILPLLYLFYSQCFNNKFFSMVAVLLFASFYIHAEEVCSSTYTRELLLSLFVLATLVFNSYYRRTHYIKYYVLAILSAIFASLSKEVAVLLPLFLLIIDYHILHGIFPPDLQSLKDMGPRLLPHIPFWLIAALLFVISVVLLRAPAVHSPLSTPQETLNRMLNNTYFLLVYTFAPCYLTDRLTIILGWVIIGGIGWLFYRSSSQRRSFIVTMIVCTGLSLLPYTISTITPRYYFFSSVFSMPLIALLAFEIGVWGHKLLETRLGRYYLSQDLITHALALLVLLPVICLNYQDVRQSTQNAVYAGMLVKEIVEGTARILPRESEGYTIIYINLPNTVQSKATLGLDYYVAYDNFYLDALDLYNRQFGTPKYRHNIKSAYIDLGYNKVRLSSKAWYVSERTEALTFTAEEFNSLSKDEKTRLLFFNPVTNKLEDVSNWSYKELEESVVPYRDKLNCPLNSLP